MYIVLCWSPLAMDYLSSTPAHNSPADYARTQVSIQEPYAKASTALLTAIKIGQVLPLQIRYWCVCSTDVTTCTCNHMTTDDE